MPGPDYIVITPARDEDRHLPLAIASMAAQTLRPRRWILVDDGSKDRTGALIDAAAAEHPWIRAIHRADRGSRQAGSGVIAAFNDGFAAIGAEPWEFISKFDGDLSFDPDYFARCLKEFALDPRLGIGGGTCCTLQDGVIAPECQDEPAFHVRGPTKIYRRACFEAIGGLIQAPGWDTVDQLKANALGWSTRTFPHIRLVHNRPTGSAYGAWNDWIKNGLANYITGYDPVFMACKCVRRSLRRPFRSGLALWLGFLKGYWKRIPQVADRSVIRFVRAQQWRALTFRSSLWRRS